MAPTAYKIYGTLIPCKKSEKNKDPTLRKTMANGKTVKQVRRSVKSFVRIKNSFFSDEAV